LSHVISEIAFERKREKEKERERYSLMPTNLDGIRISQIWNFYAAVAPTDEETHG